MKPAFRLSFALAVLSVPILADSVQGIRNFERVDAHVYRGAQPSSQGFEYLASVGVKTVIDLREADDRSRAEERIVTADGMRYVNVPMTGLTPPTDAQITQILGLLEDQTSGPVFVHCMRGADRTGAVIAAYHIDHGGWDATRALDDAKRHSMSFFQIPRQNFIRNFRPAAHTDPAQQVIASTASAEPSAPAAPKAATAGAGN